jgi:hypothetical protein
MLSLTIGFGASMSSFWLSLFSGDNPFRWEVATDLLDILMIVFGSVCMHCCICMHCFIGATELGVKIYQLGVRETPNRRFYVVEGISVFVAWSSVLLLIMVL